MKQRSSATLMTTGPIWKRIIAFAVPLFFGNLFQQLYKFLLDNADFVLLRNLNIFHLFRLDVVQLSDKTLERTGQFASGDVSQQTDTAYRNQEYCHHIKILEYKLLR